MKTKFDIGDRIKVTMIGEVVEYSIDRNGDCYVIQLDSDGTQYAQACRVYLSTEDLEVSKAEKVSTEM